jgi:hypothetical protein
MNFTPGPSDDSTFTNYMGLSEIGYPIPSNGLSSCFLLKRHKLAIHRIIYLVLYIYSPIFGQSQITLEIRIFWTAPNYIN